jgi:hypothetical protein
MKHATREHGPGYLSTRLVVTESDSGKEYVYAFLLKDLAFSAVGKVKNVWSCTFVSPHGVVLDQTEE